MKGLIIALLVLLALGEHGDCRAHVSFATCPLRVSHVALLDAGLHLDFIGFQGFWVGSMRLPQLSTHPEPKNRPTGSVRSSGATTSKRLERSQPEDAIVSLLKVTKSVVTPTPQVTSPLLADFGGHLEVPRHLEARSQKWEVRTFAGRLLRIFQGCVRVPSRQTHANPKAPNSPK